MERIDERRPADDKDDNRSSPAPHGCQAENGERRQQRAEKRRVGGRDGVVQAVRQRVFEMAVGGQEVPLERVERRPRVDLQVAGERRWLIWVFEQANQGRTEHGQQDEGCEGQRGDGEELRAAPHQRRPRTRREQR